MATRPLPGTICTGDTLSTPLVRYEFMAPPDLWMLDAIYGMLVNLAFPSRWTECGTATCDEAAQAVSNMIVTLRRSAMIGTIVAFATTNPPDGTLRCDSTVYQRVDYPALYAVLAAPYILNANQFVTPDCRAKVIAAPGNYDGIDFIFAEFLGASTYQLQDFEIPSHNHSVHGHTPTLAFEPGEVPVDSPGLDGVTGDTGGNQAHGNIQPTIVLDYAIVAR